MTTRWAIVGTGPMARAITPDFQLCENTEASMVVSRDPAKAAAFANEFQVPHSGTLADALSSSEIDGIYIANPHPFHAETAIAALEAGKHALVEKPMCMSVAETERVISVAKASGKFLMEALWQAFNPTVVELRRRVAAGVLGELRFAEATFGYFSEVNPVSRIWAPELGGGTVLDQGIYPLSLVQSIFGVPATISAHGSIGATGVDDEAVAVLEFSGGTRAVCISTLRAQLASEAYFAGTVGRIELHGPTFNPRGLTQYTWAPGDSWAEPAVEEFAHKQEGNGYVPMLRAVSTAIDAGEVEHPYRTHKSTLETMASMEEILRQLGVITSR